MCFFFFPTAADADIERGEINGGRGREHRGRKGAESKVMERTCRATEQKRKRDGKEQSYKPAEACRGNKIRAGEREAESARIHVRVEGGGGGGGEQKRSIIVQHAETKRETGRGVRGRGGRINPSPSNG